MSQTHVTSMGIYNNALVIEPEGSGTQAWRCIKLELLSMISRIAQKSSERGTAKDLGVDMQQQQNLQVFCRR